MQQSKRSGARQATQDEAASTRKAAEDMLHLEERTGDDQQQLTRDADGPKQPTLHAQPCCCVNRRS